MKRMLSRNRRRKGQTLVEYALILAFISLLAISVISLLGRQVSATFSSISSKISSAQSH